MQTIEEVRHAFTYHAPSTQEVIAAHETTRVRCGELAEHVFRTLPATAERTLALRAIEQASMYINACIARTQLQEPERT